MKQYKITLVTLIIFCTTLVPTTIYADVFCQVGENGIRTSTPFVDVTVGDNGVSVTNQKRSSTNKLGVFIGAVTGAILGTTLLPTVPVFGAIFGGFIGASLVSWLQSVNERHNYAKSSEALSVNVGPLKTQVNTDKTTLTVDEAYQRVLRANTKATYLQALQDYQAACVVRRQAIENALGQSH